MVFGRCRRVCLVTAEGSICDIFFMFSLELGSNPIGETALVPAALR